MPRGRRDLQDRRELAAGPGEVIVRAWRCVGVLALSSTPASILRAETGPEFGGDTTWTNLVAAYEGLSEPLQAPR